MYVLPYIVWNFPNATSMYMANVGFRGSILAPNACTNELPYCLWLVLLVGMCFLSRSS